MYQYSFQAANYQEQHDKLRNPKYTVQIQPAIEITTPPPRLPPAPIYQPKKQPSSLSNFEKQFYEITSGVSRNRIRSTPRPVVQNYYTRPDESYDDLTKNYFTTFGTKLAAATATTPMPPPPPPPAVQQRPISLHGDILVNFVTPRPAINPHAEIIRPQAAPQSENVQTVQAISIPVQKLVSAGQQGSFVSYELPGDNGAHFYFLTPQLTQRRDQGVTYYFSKPGKTE